MDLRVRGTVVDTAGTSGVRRAVWVSRRTARRAADAYNPDRTAGDATAAIYTSPPRWPPCPPPHPPPPPPSSRPGSSAARRACRDASAFRPARRPRLFPRARRRRRSVAPRRSVTVLGWDTPPLPRPHRRSASPSPTPSSRLRCGLSRSCSRALLLLVLCLSRRGFACFIRPSDEKLLYEVDLITAYC
jgi:hypothetical protein